MSYICYVNTDKQTHNDMQVSYTFTHTQEMTQSKLNFWAKQLKQAKEQGNDRLAQQAQEQIEGIGELWVQPLEMDGKWH